MEKVPSGVWSVGRRKSSVARIRLKAGKGDVIVNGALYKEYFSTESSRGLILGSLNAIEMSRKYDFFVRVNGGGITGQAGAVRLGIARALLKENQTLRKILKKQGLLTVDSRVKERKKPGQKGARAKFQFVKR